MDIHRRLPDSVNVENSPPVCSWNTPPLAKDRRMRPVNAPRFSALVTERNCFDIYPVDYLTAQSRGICRLLIRNISHTCKNVKWLYPHFS